MVQLLRHSADIQELLLKFGSCTNNAWVAQIHRVTGRETRLKIRRNKSHCSACYGGTRTCLLLSRAQVLRWGGDPGYLNAESMPLQPRLKRSMGFCNLAESYLGAESDLGGCRITQRLYTEKTTDRSVPTAL